MSRDERIRIIANVMIRQHSIRAGCIVESTIDSFESTAPRLAREINEDAAAILDALSDVDGALTQRGGSTAH